MALTPNQIADLHEALEKVREAGQYVNKLSPEWRHVFLTLLRLLKGDIEESKRALKFVKEMSDQNDSKGAN